MGRHKVLFIPAWYPSEEKPVAGIFVQEQAKAVSLYCDVAVIYANLAPPDQLRPISIHDAWEDGIRTVRVSYRKVSVPKMTYPRRLAALFAAYRHLAATGFDPDIIHAHVYSAGIPALLIGRRFKRPVILTEHFSGFVGYPKMSGRDKLIARVIMNRVNLVIAVSTFLGENIQRLGIRTPFQVVPNVVDTELFHPGTAGGASPGEKRKLLTVALLTPEKGIPYLLQAVKNISAKRSDIILDVIGDGPNRTEYENMTSELGLSRVVRFHGLKSKAETADYMRNCDLFVLPSLYETFGVVLIEALASGKPVIASDIGGPREIVTPEVGILVPPGNPEALAAAIDKVLGDPGAFPSDVVAEYARRKYGYEAVGRQLASLYERCVSG